MCITVNTCFETVQRIIAEKCVEPTRKIVIWQHLYTKICTTCCFQSWLQIQEFLDTPSFQLCVVTRTKRLDMQLTSPKLLSPFLYTRLASVLLRPTFWVLLQIAAFKVTFKSYFSWVLGNFINTSIGKICNDRKEGKNLKWDVAEASLT